MRGGSSGGSSGRGRSIGRAFRPARRSNSNSLQKNKNFRVTVTKTGGSSKKCKNCKRKSKSKKNKKNKKKKKKRCSNNNCGSVVSFWIM